MNLPLKNYSQDERGILIHDRYGNLVCIVPWCQAPGRTPDPAFAFDAAESIIAAVNAPTPTENQ
jgi:hypothetical protein